jgi:formylmethanofuran dehydrogenase subunit C
MKEIILTPKEQPSIWLEAEVIKPDIFAGKELKDIEALEIFYGNKKVMLGDFFEVSGSVSDKAVDIRIIIAGDVSRTKRIGEEMSAGEILIKGSADMYVGARMKGGKIIIEGNADAFAGQQLAGGELIIKGNAGNYLGSSYRGDWRGMKGGVIIVEGNAGSEIAEFMLGGRIRIKGSVGAFAGLHMKKGSIVIDGNAAGRVGAQMTGGSIVVNGKVGSLLPGFKLEKKEKDIKIDGEEFKGTYSKYTGDHAEREASGVLYVKE